MYDTKNNLIEGFTKKYNCTDLVYFEHTTDIYAAIAREKEIKGWKRSRKDELVLQNNLQWRDLLWESGF